MASFWCTVSNGIIIYGINCLATNVNPNGIDQITSYGFAVVQTILSDTHTLVLTNGSSTTFTNDVGLDNLFPTQAMGDGDGTLFSDLPGIAYYPTDLTNASQFSTFETFSTTLMFSPYDGIWVPMKEIKWGWSGTVSLEANQWSLSSSNAVIILNNQNTQTFPVWTNVIKSFIK